MAGSYVPLKQTLDRIPGGMMLVPLLLGCLVINLAPGAPKYLGSFSGALFTGAMPILAVFYVCMGATIELKTTPYVLAKGGTLLATKFCCGLLVALVLGRLLGGGRVTSGFFTGLSTLAVVA